MGFFSDLKEDLSQAVNELAANEGMEEALPNEETPKADTAFSGDVPTSDELSDMLDRMGDLDAFRLNEEPALAYPHFNEAGTEGAGNPASEADLPPAAAEPVMPEPAAVMPEPVMPELELTESAPDLAQAESAAEDVAADEINIETEPVIPEPAEMNKSIDDNGREERKMEIQTKVATDETAVVTEGMSITGDIISGGSLELIGAVTGNIEVLGKLNITGAIHGNSKAAEIYAEGARINGEMNAQGSIKIGQSSVVIGNIAATSAVIAGAVKGDIDVHGPVVLDTSAIVMGNIKSKSVQINNGAVIEGLCSQCYADVNPTSFFEEIKKKK